MARIKIDYGIDLGTTNSAICRMDQGVPTIIKTDVLKDTMPSCVSVNKKGTIKAGDGAYNTMKQDKRRATLSWQADASNTYVEFKRTMGTDTEYPCNNLGKTYSSEELSAEVLKMLKSFVTDETFSSVVITVPAKFTVNQKTATIQAAQLAGFDKCELIQEPIAAAMAYGLTTNDKNGIWMVFDFGGGTFDAALLKVEDGIMQVFDTEGDNYLGGKNLDYAIVDQILLPYLQKHYSIEGILADENKRAVLRDAMKTYAEEIKIQVSFKDKEDIISNIGELGEDEEGEEMELDLTITQREIFDIMRPYYQKAVNICQDLVKRNNLTGNHINKLILVGGPTYSPLIRQMLQEQITPNVDTSIDPMTAVAKGAALYAAIQEASPNLGQTSTNAIQLNVGYEASTVEASEWVTISLASNNTQPSVLVELIRSDKAWSSGKVSINKTGEVLEINLVEGRPNSFSILCYDLKGNLLPCFPSEITIIQGTKVGAAPLPYNIGIAKWDEVKKRGVFRMAKGLEKNKTLPAIGIISDLKTPDTLRAGHTDDLIKIPVYQTDNHQEAEGKTASLYEYVADVVITGLDVEQTISKDSLVDVTLKVDSSEQMTIEVHFITTDITVSKVLDTSKKQSIESSEVEIQEGLKEGQKLLKQFNEQGIDTYWLQSRLNEVKAEYESSTEKKMVLQHLKEVLRQIDELEEDTEWKRIENALNEELNKLRIAQKDLGNEQTGQAVLQLRQQADEVLRTKNTQMGRILLNEIDRLFMSLTLLYQLIGWIEHHDQHFKNFRWRNPSEAQQLIHQGKLMIQNRPDTEALLDIVRTLIELLPREERGDNNHGLLV